MMVLARNQRTQRRVLKGLVVTREPGEDIQIDLPDGQTIIVQIASVDRGGRVRLLTEAPKDFLIRRGELVALDERAA